MSNHAAEPAAPDLHTDADLALIERTPWQKRIPARNTYALLRAACERRPQRHDPAAERACDEPTDAVGNAGRTSDLILCGHRLGWQRSEVVLVGRDLMSAELLEKFEQKMIAATPLQRLGGDEDLMGTVTFLASAASRHITAQYIDVDSGAICC